MRLQIQNNKEYIKELENYIERLEHEEDRLREKLLNKDKEIERLNNIINKIDKRLKKQFAFYFENCTDDIVDEEWGTITPFMNDLRDILEEVKKSEKKDN